MELRILREVIKKKENKSDFALITNLENGNSEIFENSSIVNKDFQKHINQIDNFYRNKKSGIIENTNIFVQTYSKQLKVIIIGAVHIAQYIVEFSKNLNFDICIIDPRKYFVTKERFFEVKIINKWPDKALNEIELDTNTALISLTHDPKIDDSALQHALKKKFYYIGALGSKKTNANRCERLKKAGFSNDEINSIHGPIGIKLGGKSAPEIALSIISQLVAETYKK